MPRRPASPSATFCEISPVIAVVRSKRTSTYVLSLHRRNYRLPGLVEKLVPESLKLNFLKSWYLLFNGTCNRISERLDFECSGVKLAIGIYEEDNIVLQE